MSSAPRLRRADKLMAEEQALATLERGFAGHLATVGENGHPYCLPLLYVWADGRIYLHNSRAKGHLRSNVDHESRVCFAVDEAGEAFAYGRFECDSAVAYRSVIVFGTIAVVDDIATKQRFCERLMVKYAKPEWDRPKGFFPRLAERLGAASLPAGYRRRLGTALDRALLLAEDVARHPEAEAHARSAASALYNAVSAVLLAWEGTRDPADARRTLLSRMVLEHRLAPRDPLAPEERGWEVLATDLLLAGKAVPMAEAAELLG